MLYGNLYPHLIHAVLLFAPLHSLVISSPTAPALDAILKRSPHLLVKRDDDIVHTVHFPNTPPYEIRVTEIGNDDLELGFHTINLQIVQRASDRYPRSPLEDDGHGNVNGTVEFADPSLRVAGTIIAAPGEQFPWRLIHQLGDMFSADHIPLYYKNTYEATFFQDVRVLGNVWVYARPTRPFKPADHYGYVLVENPVGVGGWDPCIGHRCELKKVKRDEEE